MRRLTLVALVVLLALVATSAVQAQPSATQASQVTCNNKKFLGFTAALFMRKMSQALDMMETNSYSARRTALQARNILVTGTIPCHRMLSKYRAKLWYYASVVAEAAQAWGRDDTEAVTYWMQKASEGLDDAGFYLDQYRNA